jgi:imidazolonepropionase-like amidohydrolase
MAFAAFLLSLTSPALAADTEYQRVPAAIHLHTTFSTGVYSLEDLIEIAHAAGVRVAIVTDHDTMRFD